MDGRTIVAFGAALGALAVAIGAFGAHGLRDMVTPDQLQVFETGVRYHFYHALALVLVGVFGLATSTGATGAAWSFVAGIAIFSGSLYVMTLTGMRWLGAITPIGGVAFIVGWVLFARAALSR